MKNVPAFAQKIRTRAIGRWSHRVGFLALGLIIGVFLAACSGGSTPPDQPSNALAASQDNAANQEADPNGDIAAASQDSAANQEDTAGQQGDASKDAAASADSLPGTEEFGMTKEELVENIETVEALIAECMSEAGFEYFPVDYLTVRKAMTSDKSAAGLSDEEYRAAFGYGISTRLDIVDAPPQLAGPDTVFQIGLGEQNIEIFKNLSEADQVAYNHTLFGENTQATFAYTLEDEDFSETGGCTRAAIEQVFSPEELSASYYNPGDALIEQDPRVIKAIANWSDCMREEGFDYNNPEEVEPDIEDRLDAILDGAAPESLSADAQAALTELQGEERAIAVKDLECEEEFIEPAVQQVESELYGGPQN